MFSMNKGLDICVFLDVLQELRVQDLFVCLFLTRQPPMGQGLLITEVSGSHTTTDRSR